MIAAHMETINLKTRIFGRVWGACFKLAKEWRHWVRLAMSHEKGKNGGMKTEEGGIKRAIPASKKKKFGWGGGIKKEVKGKPEFFTN